MTSRGAPGDVAVRAAGLRKRYSRSNRAGRRRGLSAIRHEVLGRAEEATLRPTEFWALDGLSFDVERGTALGVMGLNGSGKSTLLRVVAGISKPDDGRIEVNGSVAALLDAMGGFDPLLTGRENVAASPIVAANSFDDVEQIIERAIDFAELGDFIDAPIRSYSKGMHMRLGFSVALASDPDILLVDEVLAVGDASFQRKCMARLRSFVAQGGSLMVVSHSLWALEALCDRGLLLHQGAVLASGTVHEVTGQYSDLLLERELDQGQDLPIAGGAPRRTPAHREPASVESVTPEKVVDADGTRLIGPRNGRPVGFTRFELVGPDGGRPVAGGRLTVRLGYRSDHAASSVDWAIMLFSRDGQIAVAGSMTPPEARVALVEGDGSLELTVDELPLGGGLYTARLALIDAQTQVVLGLHGMDTAATPFEVVGDPEELELPNLPVVPGALRHGGARWSVSARTC